MNPEYPWRIGSNGLTAQASDIDHARQMIEQLLLTNVGERVNRPDFGGGLYQLIFAPNSQELSATLQLTLQAGVQRYLADVVDVGGLTVSSDDNRLLVEVPFQMRDSGITSAATVEIPLGAP